MPKFRLDWFSSLILTSKYQYCYGFGWERGAIEFEILMTTIMQQCYKKWITNLCDRSAAWTGIDAKYIDECDSSAYVTAPLK